MPASRPIETQYLIQYLRAFAAAAVVFHHASHEVVSAAHAPSLIGAYPGLAALGACGVDVFFVVSGFIIFFTMSAETGPRKAVAFLRDRFLRVMPLYWFWTSLLALAIVLRLAFTNLDFSLAMAVSSYLLIPYEKLPGNAHPILDPGWTLAFEMYFYAVAALLIATLPYGPRLVGLATVLAVVHCAISIGPVPAGIRDWLASPLVYEFVAGAAIAVAVRAGVSGARPRTGTALMWTGAACLAATALLPDAMSSRVLLWGIPATLLVLGAVLANAPPRGPAGRLLFRLGSASYALYLAHGFATIALGAALKRGHLLWIDPDLLIAGATLVTVALGSATHAVVERPLLMVLRGARPAHALHREGPVPATWRGSADDAIR